MNKKTPGWDQFLASLTQETPAQAWVRKAAAKLRDLPREDAEAVAFLTYAPKEAQS